ncbi:TAXI family TRAP transporter solute-binding subunit [Nitratireductor aquimarinus]|uniref:TAXI family TRAP transporter solute-binding subunit n=1 Tax=Alphaproteobacteria TaxID=28211 RepID=UPI0019D397C8|nr:MULTISPECIES: TAXI family TRAP transporter solute-binding subunit [Alphaproteobacteria]MBY6020472.1 TAXI family TRAP transporter solute-binding subunit [Nitratireductor sp. DP7N14-4]MBN7755686.1 TAXI family TRAP transporter solute-binding subunit [Nitratireductor aquimarinus]MBN7763234.1 TAXI family TRAP transporter solute-binding subunit [Nitratireductor aquibiodomus]MBY5998440.1 TAXI family TRAP transporter solute-binding subunit [Tritonibacter mobilis]MCV0349083.1 TAXI family TRAP transp
MKPHRILGFGLAAAMLGSLATGTASAQEQRFVSVGTGGVTGVYYPVGGAICRLMNQNRRETGIRCSVESTGGSVFNVNAIKGGDLEFGVVQSDVQYNANKGEANFADGGAHDKLRSVFSLHAEPLTLVARKEAGIASFDDLKGKRVNIGNPGSGQRALMDLLIAEKGWTNSDFAVAAELAPAEQSSALCDNNIDAFAYTVGHPAGAIQEATTTCDSVIVAVEGEAVDKLVADNPYYFKATIPGGMYRGTDNDVNTFGVGATVVTSADVPDDVVAAFVDAVFKDFDAFKALHPALANLTPESMVNQGNSAPMHPGAEAYYKEKGWLK